MAIADALHGGVMRTRFHAEPIIQATELLLQERTPRDVAVARPRAEEVKADASMREIAPPTIRRFHSPHDLIPRTHLLSNGRYTVMITAAGSGFSRWRDLAVTRWREDVTCDSWGSYIFLRDVQQRQSLVGRATSRAASRRTATKWSFRKIAPRFVRHDGTITTTLEVAVSPEDDAEVRRVSISNLGSRAREIELTSYAEIVLAPDAADAAHPAFSKMFVQTEFDADAGALLATRRPRSAADAQVWAAHLAVVEGESTGDVQFETDRARFLGRGRAHSHADLGNRRPAALQYGRHRARSDFQSSPPRANTAGRHRARRVLDDGCADPRRGARPRGQASRRHRLRAGGDARVDPGASAAPSPRRRPRRSASVSASGQSRALFRSDAAAVRPTC